MYYLGQCSFHLFQRAHSYHLYIARENIEEYWFVEYAGNWYQRSPKSGKGLCFVGMVAAVIYCGLSEGFFASSSIVSPLSELP